MDVHIALITAVSYAKERAERFYTSAKTNHQIIREYIDLFGFMSKNPNAMVREPPPLSFFPHPRADMNKKTCRTS